MLANQKRAIISLVAIFLLGFALGVLVNKAIYHNKQRHWEKQDPGEFLFNRFTERLELDTDQQAELRAKLDQLKNDIDSLSALQDKQFMQARNTFDNNFKKILTDEQKVTFDQMLEEAKKHYMKHR